LYIEYAADKFEGLVVDQDLDNEFYNFIEDIKTNGPRFYGYTPEQLENFVSRIYELRKNNSNNAAG
jgi:hypothetical protein